MVMALSNQEALRCKKEHIETEHLLIALITEGHGTGVAILRNLSIDVDKLCADLRKSAGCGSDGATRHRLQPASRTKEVVVLAIDEAKTLHHEIIGTEHILAGLLREQQSAAAKALFTLGLTAEAIRAEILRLAAAPEPTSASSPRGMAGNDRTILHRIALWLLHLVDRP